MQQTMSQMVFVVVIWDHVNVCVCLVPYTRHKYVYIELFIVFILQSMIRVLCGF